jgi:putative tricarboxylic transport membrane protein
MLKSRGWDDIFLSGPALEEYVKNEQTRTAAVLKEVGLAK